MRVPDDRPHLNDQWTPGGNLTLAGSGARFQCFVQDFFAIRNRSSPLGTYSIDQNGDTSLGPSAFVIEHGPQLAPIQQG